MADFEGIRLTGEGRACGCVLMLRASPVISRVVNLPQGAEVEVRSGVPTVVVRRISATIHDSVLFQGPAAGYRPAPQEAPASRKARSVDVRADEAADGERDGDRDRDRAEGELAQA